MPAHLPLESELQGLSTPCAESARLNGDIAWVTDAPNAETTRNKKAQPDRKPTEQKQHAPPTRHAIGIVNMPKISFVGCGAWHFVQLSAFVPIPT
jgi:hypothetical protein